MLRHTVTYTTNATPIELTASIPRRHQLTYRGATRVLATLLNVDPQCINVIRIDVIGETR